MGLDGDGCDDPAGEVQVDEAGTDVLSDGDKGREDGGDGSMSVSSSSRSKSENSSSEPSMTGSSGSSYYHPRPPAQLLAHSAL